MIADLCTPVVPQAPDAAEAAEYARTGDEAKAAGDVRIALVAYRKAAAFGDPRAATQIRELCAAAAPEPTLDDGIALFKRGELEKAEAVLAALDTPGSHFFLGAIALRRHDGTEAEAQLQLAARDPAYASASRTLLRIAHRTGRFEALLFVGGEVDTNPQLVPDTPPVGATTTPSPDANGQLAATTVARPWQWLALRNALVWRQQATESDLDFVGDTASLGIEDDHGPDHLVIRYDLDYDVLGGEQYLVAHRGTLGYRRELGGWDLGGSYAFRTRDFQRATEQVFNGEVHTAEVTSTVHVSPELDIDGKLFGWRELTQEALFTNWSLGAQLGLRARPRDRLRFGASLGSWYGLYDGADPNGDLRRDAHADANGEIEVDVADHVIALAAVTATINRSTIVDFDYWKLVARIGVAFAIGGP
ncbi:MAG TPA: hypothetical protein VLT45_23630 [Kofleriaceae bacterium]|nr:hypothetical protein [Kofleriaceae bacterium]